MIVELFQKYRVRTGPGKPGKSWNLIIWIPGLESHGIFGPGPGKSWNFMLANLYAAELPTVLDCLTCMRGKTLNYGNM